MSNSMLKLDKNKCMNILIIISLLFFVGVTASLLVLLYENGMIVLSDTAITFDNITSIAVLVIWIAFIIFIMAKALTIYKKIA